VPRPAARILGALLVLGALGSGAATVAGASQPRQAGALLGDGDGDGATVTVETCDVPAVVAVVLPADRFDAGRLVWVTGLDAPGIEVVPAGALPGEALAVRLVVDPAEAAVHGTVELRAAGLHHGEPAEVIDRLAVEVACPA
jgi:hypothetical protein